MSVNFNPGEGTILMMVALVFLFPLFGIPGESVAFEVDGEGGGGLTTTGGATLTITPNTEYNLFPLYTYNFTFSFPANDITHFNLTFTHDNFKFDIRGGFLRSLHVDTSEAEEYADIPPEEVTLARTTSGWNLSMKIKMYWTLPQGNYSLELKVFNNSGKEWRYLWKDAFFYSKRIGINWYGTLLNEHGRNVLGQWVGGREKVLISNVILNFYTESGNRSGFIPIMDDFNFTLDGGTFNNWRWQLSTALSSNGYYTLPLVTPLTSGRLDCTLSLDNLPPGATIVRKLSFSLYIDSEKPTITYEGYSNLDNTLVFRVEVKDSHSGIDKGSLSSRIFYGTDEVVPVRVLSTYYDGNIYSIHTTYSGPGYYYIETTAVDRAGNTEKKNITVEVDPGDLSDLAIMGARILSLPVVNQSVAIEITVGNLGEKDVEGATLQALQDSNPIFTRNLGLLRGGESARVNIKVECYSSHHTISILLNPPSGVVDVDESNNRLDMEISPVTVDLKVAGAEATLSDEGDVNLHAKIVYRGVEPLSDVEYHILYDTLLVKVDFIEQLSPGQSYTINVSLFGGVGYRNITVVVDPHDLLHESNEMNNIAVISNPAISATSGTQLPEKETSPDEEHDEPQSAQTENATGEGGDENDTSQAEGGGEEASSESGMEDSQEEGNGLNDGGGGNVVIVPNVPDEDAGGNNGWSGFPVSVTVVVVQLFLSLLLFVEALHREALRYKLLSLLIPLYSKLKKDKIESGVRWEILGYLKAKPYATYSELKRDLGLTNGTLMHHLRILEREELIHSRRVGKYKIFYHVDKRMPENFQHLSPIKRKLLEYIMDNPGAVQKSLSRIFRKSQTDLNYHLNELYRMGLIKKKREGKYVKYYPV